MAIDLEHFPTNETALRMMERISPIYDRSYVGKWIFEIMGMEMGEARAYFEELRRQPFPERTTWTIEYWERRYAITPKPADDLETRRRNIIMKRGARLPMNPARMEQIINDLTGGNTVVTENVDDYTFRVTIDGAALGMNTLAVIKEIKRRKPSHQCFDYSVVVRAKKPATLRLGGLMTSVVRLPIPQVADSYRFESTLRAGGHMTSVIRRPIPAVEDRFEFQSTIRVGGYLTSSASIPVPQLPDKISMTHTSRVGGRTAIITTIPVPELPE